MFLNFFFFFIVSQALAEILRKFRVLSFPYFTQNSDVPELKTLPLNLAKDRM